MPEENISPALIHSGLRTKFIGQNILYYPVTTSTMDVAKEVVQDGATEGTAVVADEQTLGRGRLGRRWLSPPGTSILLSMVLYPNLAQLSRLNMVAAVAISQAIEKATGLKPVIKWPNDVLINGKKISGVLIESEVRGDDVNSAVVGIGVNINLDPSTLPEVAATATSLKVELGKEVPRLEVLQSLLREFESLYLALRKGEPIQKRWLERLETLGKPVQINTGDSIVEGYAESVDADGSLLVRRLDESLTVVSAGEVTLRS